MVNKLIKKDKIQRDQENIFLHGHYQRNRILLITLGIWPESPLWLTITTQCLLGLSTITILIPQYAFLIRVCHNLESLVTAMVEQLTVAIAYIKFYYCGTGKEWMQTMINSVKEDWGEVDDSLVETLHIYAKKGYMRTTIYMATLYSITIIYCGSPLKSPILDVLYPLNHSRPRFFPLQVDYSIYGINANDYFITVLMHCFITVMVVVHFLVTIDTFISIMVLHCCGVFAVVGDMLQQIQADCSPREQYEILCNGIRKHRRAIALAETIETSFTMMYGFVVFFTMVLMSCGLLQLIMKIDQPTEIMRGGSFDLASMLHLFFITLQGQELYDHSSELLEKIFSCNWPGMSLKAKQLISIMLMRSIKPMQMTAAKFFPLNIESFGKVLKTSFSVFTMMLSSR
ncbi:putative odorant receptor 59c isoform X1 [Diachasmimorpha longicaudata]|uniref:putative odorant receptor 59c isoform X1 n=1 Tax=Diachasmimorpha longicaudata TaxID=58733 RepID=UPI0030B8E0C6